MPFQMPIKVAEVLLGIQTNKYVLPAIQRGVRLGAEPAAPHASLTTGALGNAI